MKRGSNTSVDDIKKRVLTNKLLEFGFDSVRISNVDGKPSATFSIGDINHSVELSDLCGSETKEVSKFSHATHVAERVIECKLWLSEINQKIEDLKMKIYLRPDQSEDELRRLMLARSAIENTLKIIS